MSHDNRLEVPVERTAQIEAEITSPESPVGIDAKRTHVIIVHKLLEIEERLERIEARLASRSG